MITGLYASLFTFFLIFLVLGVVKRRRANRVSLGHGGVEELEKYVRAHGNFIETVPIALFLMLLIELAGLTDWVLHAMGVTLLVARILHYQALTMDKQTRVISMILTLGVLAVGAVLNLISFLGLLPGFLLAL